MTWGEAIRHAHTLASDPSSMIAAALHGWDHPVTREALALMDLFDLQHQIAWAQGGKKGPRPKPYPRPWPDRKKSRPRPTVTPQVAIAALRAAGHTAELPSKLQHLEAASG